MRQSVLTQLIYRIQFLSYSYRIRCLRILLTLTQYGVPPEFQPLFRHVVILIEVLLKNSLRLMSEPGNWFGWEVKIDDDEVEEETDSDSSSNSYSNSEETANSQSQFQENSNGMATHETEVQMASASHPSSVSSERKITSFYQEELYIVLTLLREMCSYNDVMIEVTIMKRDDR